MFEGEVQFVGAGSGICFLPDEGGGSTEGVDGAGMVSDPEPDWIRIQSVQVYPDPEKSYGGDSGEVRRVGGGGG